MNSLATDTSSDPPHLSHAAAAAHAHEETREETREGTGEGRREELGMEIYLKFFPDGAEPLRRIFRQAGLRVVLMPGVPVGFQDEDEHLQVTASFYAKITDAAVDEFRDAVWSGIRLYGSPYGEGTSDIIDQDEIDEIRADYSMLWAERALATDSGWSMQEVEEVLTRLAAKGLIADRGVRGADGGIVWVRARPWRAPQFHCVA